MPRMKDFTGLVFGSVTVLSPADRRGNRNRTAWNCRCECGRERVIIASNLNSIRDAPCRCAGRGGRRRLHERSLANLMLSRYRSGNAPVDYEVRFWMNVRCQDSGCWEWSKCRHPEGYGEFWAGRRFRTHRYSWQMHFGDIPDGMFVCHHCDNPPCVNPAHLFLGTHQDNMRDMIAKGRRNKAAKPRRRVIQSRSERSYVGQENPNGRLTEEAARQIISRLAKGELHTAIAADFPISHWAVAKIAQGRSWAHLPR